MIGAAQRFFLGTQQRFVGKHLALRDIDDRLKRHPRAVECAHEPFLETVFDHRVRALAAASGAMFANGALDGRGQRLDRERLRDVRDCAVIECANRTIERWLAGHEENRQVDVTATQRFDELEAAEARHLNIGQHAVERAGIAELRECGLAVGCDDNFPAIRGEDARTKAADHRIIINNEDATELGVLLHEEAFLLCAAG